MSLSDLPESFLIPGPRGHDLVVRLRSQWVGGKKGKQALCCGGFPGWRVWDSTASWKSGIWALRSSRSLCHQPLRLHK